MSERSESGTSKYDSRTVERPCPRCGAGKEHTVPAWDNYYGFDDGEEPDYIGCRVCGRFTEVAL